MFGCSFISRSPAPRPIVWIVIAGSGPNSSATVLTIAAPVGVVSSNGTTDGASGTPLRISAVAGAGTLTRPCSISM